MPPTLNVAQLQAAGLVSDHQHQTLISLNDQADDQTGELEPISDYRQLLACAWGFWGAHWVWECDQLPTNRR